MFEVHAGLSGLDMADLVLATHSLSGELVAISVREKTWNPGGAEGHFEQIGLQELLQTTSNTAPIVRLRGSFETPNARCLVVEHFPAPTLPPSSP